MLKRIKSLGFMPALGLYFAGVAFLAIILALAGFFYNLIIALYFFAGVFFFAYYFSHSLKNFTFDWKRAIFFVLLASFAAYLALSAFPTIFSGRDQGSLSEAAIRLSQNHELAWHSDASDQFFKIYGPGPALNFPGFYYQNDGRLITQFPLGYISWLGAFYSLFGLSGLVAANAVSFFLFLAAFYLISKKFLPEKRAVIVILFALSSFIFSWFFKFTLSENLALFLLWFGIFEFLRFWEEDKPIYLYASLFYFYVLAFARVETWAFLFVISAILLFRRNQKKFDIKQIFNRKVLLVSVFFAIVFAINIFANQPFYREFVRGFLRSVNLISRNEIESVSYLSQLAYLFKVFNSYFMLIFLVLGMAGFIFSLKKDKFDWLLPFLIILPSFIYVLHPGITPDHPWMLRRFIFALIPGSILYTVIFLDATLRTRWLFGLASAIIILMNLAISIPYWNYSENRELSGQIGKISQDFKSDDLVLVDRDATGDGWSMMTGPLGFLYEKQAVYFFNPNDLEKIDVSRFGNIYLIIPEKNIPLYKNSLLGKKIVPLKEYQIASSRLDIKTGGKAELFSSPAELPLPKNYLISGKIYSYKP
jgi:hypothetical protein